MFKYLLSLAVLIMSTSSAMAATFSLAPTATGMFEYYQKFNGSNQVYSESKFFDKQWNGIVAKDYIQNVDASTQKRYEDVAVMKFDLGSLKSQLNGEVITSVKLKATGYSRRGTPLVNVFQSSADWNTAFTKSQNTFPEYDLTDSLGTMMFTGNNLHPWGCHDPYEAIIDFASVDEFFGGDDIISLLLDQTNPLSPESATRIGYEQNLLSFINTSPRLIVETAPAPAPEPSTMLLGMLGIAGLARRRKRA